MLFSQNNSGQNQLNSKESNVKSPLGSRTTFQKKTLLASERRTGNISNENQDALSKIDKVEFTTQQKVTFLEQKGKNKMYTSYSKLSEVKLLTIGIASPLRILQWAEKTLPNRKVYGEVLNANTLHHKTFKPQKGGLFCERIFGPLKDFECACGKINKTVKQDMTKTSQTDGTKSNSAEVPSGIASAPLGFQQPKQMRKYCPDCDVEYTWSVIRRYQLGYIKLSSPVTHVWFLKGTPSYLSLLLDMKKRHLQLVTYCSETLTLENSLSNSQKSLFIDSPAKIFATWEAIWKPKKEMLNQPNQPDKTLKRFNVKPTPQKDWKKRMAIQTDMSHALEVTHLTLNKELKNNLGVRFALGKIDGVDFTQAPAANSKSERSFPKENFFRLTNQYSDSVAMSLDSPLAQKVQKLPLFLSTLHWSLYCNPKTEVNVLDSFNVWQADLIQNFYNSGQAGTQKASQTIGYQNQSVFDTKTTTAKMNRIYKNLPIDYYILCSLDRFLQKKLIRLAIRNTWQTIYKDAYINAMYKANKLFNKKDQITLLNNLDVNANTRLTQNYSQTPAAKQFMNISKFYSLFYGMNYDPSFITSEDSFQDFGTSAHGSVGKKLKQLLEKVKLSYKNHVAMILKKMKQPIFLSKYTTNISFSILDELMNSTMDMQKYLYMDTKHFSKILSNSFVRPLLMAQFFSSYNSKTTEENLQSKFSMNFSKENVRLKKFSEGKLLSDFEFASRTTIEHVNLFSASSLKESLEKMAAFSVSPSLTNAKRDVLKQYLLFYKQKFQEFNSFKIRQFMLEETNRNESTSSEDFLQTELSLNSYFRSKNFYQTIPLEKNNSLLNQKNRNPGKSPQYDGRVSDLKAPSGPKPSVKSVYNNVYTLSHRERWESDKDWQVFLLYHSAATEFNDIPISAYKSRVFSFTEKNAFTFGGTEQNVLPSYTAGAFGEKTKMDWKESMNLSNAFFSGPGIIQQLLRELTFPELKKLDKQNRLLLYQLNQNILKIKKQVKVFVYDKSAQLELKDLCKKRDLLIRRTKLVRKLFRKDSDPSSMILTVLPVLPPDLRPIVKMGSQIAASDLNRLYQQVIYRNERLKFFLKDPATSHSYEMKYAQRLLQEAVDNLIQNSKSATTSEKDSRGRALKSLSDVLKGKQGRFRQFLLGKRVDYSGRSVIVVGPKLKLHECGLPVEMALELYLPFLLKRILNKKYAKTVIGAKSLIKNNTALAHELLREIMQVSPVLLNRAPTLHRLGIQAFVPKLVEGRAILLHPLVCSAFNADFDGDQMAVHVPITVEARAEAWKLMLSRNNILSPATGDPLAIPSQDMVLGCYYLTTYSKSLYKKNLPYQSFTSEVGIPNADASLVPMERQAPLVSKSEVLTIQSQQFYFNHLEDVIAAFNQQKLKIHTLVWVKWNGLIENGNDQEEPIEVRLTSFGQWQEITANYQRFYDSNNVLVNQYMATTPGRILFNLIIQDSLK